jgi:SAM-dependent methyltransferase
MPKAISREDVINGYALLLGRSPADEEIEAHLAQGEDLWTWISRIAASEDARRYQYDRLSSVQMQQFERPPPEVEVSGEAIRTLLRHVGRVWSRLGDRDPYWSVLSDEKYRGHAVTAAEIEEFYCSGAGDVADLEAVCRSNEIVIDRDCTILELGCGLGRIGEHFARRYRRYIGVDISPAHLRRARQRFNDRSIDNATLLPLADFLADPPRFDVFYSLLTLQHSPPPVIFHLLQQCLARLRPGGCAFFQLPCHLFDYEFRLADYLSEIGTDPDGDMEMHALPQRYVFRAFAASRVIPLDVVPWPRIGPIGLSYAFLGRKRQSSRIKLLSLLRGRERVGARA